MIKEQLYVRLRELRKERKLSQNDVAEYLHISRQSVSQWETGRAYPDIDNLVLLCDLYKISLDELLATSGTYKADVQIVTEPTTELSQKSKWMEELKNRIEMLAIFILLGLASQIPFIGIILPTFVLVRTLKRHKREKIIYIVCLIGLVLGIYNTYAIINHYFMPDVGTTIIESI